MRLWLQVKTAPFSLGWCHQPVSASGGPEGDLADANSVRKTRTTGARPPGSKTSVERACPITTTC